MSGYSRQKAIQLRSGPGQVIRRDEKSGHIGSLLKKEYSGRTIAKCIIADKFGIGNCKNREKGQVLQWKIN